MMTSLGLTDKDLLTFEDVPCASRRRTREVLLTSSARGGAHEWAPCAVHPLRTRDLKRAVAAVEGHLADPSHSPV
jgi:hypothetical protein